MSTLNVLVLSDLHLEFGNFLLTQGDADVIVLAGDIYTGTRGIEWARDSLPRCPVIYVAGNHEHWKKTLPSHIDALRDAARNSHVFFLENDAVTIDGVRFHGCTLWTDFGFHGEAWRELCLNSARKSMNDYRKITCQHNGIFRALNPHDTARLHETSLAWLGHSLRESTASANVVVTHHAPSTRSIADHYRLDLMTANYASHLDEFIFQHQPTLWIHGHTHSSVDYVIDQTRVVCNPRGYRGYGTNEHFDPHKIIEISYS